MNDIELLSQISKFNRYLNKQLQNELIKSGYGHLNYADILTLHELHNYTQDNKKPNIITPQKLAQECLYMISHLTFNIKNLERHNLITVHGDITNFSNNHIYITPAGQDVYNIFLKQTKYSSTVDTIIDDINAFYMHKKH